MSLQIFNILKSGILAQAMFFASEPLVQAQYTPYETNKNVTRIKYPEISAAPEKNTRVNESDKTFGYLLLGGCTLAVGALLILGSKSIRDFAQKKQGELNEIITWREN